MVSLGLSQVPSRLGVPRPWSHFSGASKCQIIVSQGAARNADLSRNRLSLHLACMPRLGSACWAPSPAEA